ncbi:hypothetical protein GQ55_3G450100 [Panicum hallii var. hallii]|uniref:Uncharacterized protein n=1 Tax=Panicum hallii var. hallii TaxID=1504633 RepID=A0A2T7EIF7_9POAL|nr:hypothetical protein GQ55_3G450100 [Panicum hallii var. hallii]
MHGQHLLLLVHSFLARFPLVPSPSSLSSRDARASVSPLRMSSIASSMVELLLRRLILGGNKSRAGEGRRPEGGGKFDLGAGSELLFRGLGAAGAEGKALVEGEQSWSAATEEACLLSWMGKLRQIETDGAACAASGLPQPGAGLCLPARLTGERGGS